MMVLVVEDDPSQRALLIHVLERMGFATAEAESIEEARQVERADLIIADWQLGEHTAEELHTGVPMIVLSGYSKPEHWTGIWLEKPIDLADLRKKVAKAIAEAGL